MLAFTSVNKSEHSRWPVLQCKTGQRNGKTTVILITHNSSDPAVCQRSCTFSRRRSLPALRLTARSVRISYVASCDFECRVQLYLLFSFSLTALKRSEADRNRGSPRAWNNRFLEANRATARFCIIGNPRACARAISLSELICRKHGYDTSAARG
jgi:hypothetical protein